MKRSQARSPDAIEFARSQRATANEFAGTVWQWVRNRQIGNQKFPREYAIPPYTADFCCVELKLILEIDGADYLTEDGRQRDRVRDDFLNRHGYRVMRIPGYDVLCEPGLCLARITEQVQQRMNEMEIEITAKWSELGITGKQRVRDVWRQKDIGEFSDSYTAKVG
jgi:very-short-patch-repair endonuclease